MMNAYDRIYLEKARNSLGRMLDYAIYDLNYELTSFWEMFLVSPISTRFEHGDSSIVAGKSGIELALMVLEKDKDYVKPIYTEERSAEYWLGWSLAYYQWKTHLSFSQITEQIPILEVYSMYSPYHEMDIHQLCDKLSELYLKRRPGNNLKQKRLAAGLSQSQLATLTGIPVRTIQQYEQAQKDINKASAEYVISLSNVLQCEPQLLLEPNL